MTVEVITVYDYYYITTEGQIGLKNFKEQFKIPIPSEINEIYNTWNDIFFFHFLIQLEDPSYFGSKEWKNNEITFKMNGVTYRTKLFLNNENHHGLPYNSYKFLYPD